MTIGANYEASDFDITHVEDTGDDTIVRIPAVIHDTGQCRSAIYQKMADDHFPKQRKIGKRAVGWSRRDIQKYIRITLSGGEYRASKHQK